MEDKYSWEGIRLGGFATVEYIQYSEFVKPLLQVRFMNKSTLRLAA
jgi:hypothetical protein